MESGSHISYTKTLEEQTFVYLSIGPPNLSMMLVWNDLADPHLSAFSDFARFSQTLTLKSLACAKNVLAVLPTGFGKSAFFISCLVSKRSCLKKLPVF